MIDSFAFVKKIVFLVVLSCLESLLFVNSLKGKNYRSLIPDILYGTKSFS